MKEPSPAMEDPSSRDDEEPQTASSSWRGRLADLVRNYWRTCRMLVLDDEPTRRRFAMGCALSVLAIVGYRQRKMLQRLLLATLSSRRRRKRIQQQPSSYLSATDAPLSLIYQSTKEGRVEKALLGATGVFFQLSDGVWRKASLPPNSPRIQQEMFQTLSANCSDVQALPEPLSSQLATPLVAALPFVYLALVYRMMQNLHGKDGGELAKSYSQASVKTTFRDVAGMDDVVLEVAEVVKFLKAPDEYNRLGAEAPRGVLLYGPPGSGKTLLAQAVAGEACVDCFLACSASEFVELYVGRGAARVRSLFAQIRQQARRSKQAGSWYRWCLSLLSPRSSSASSSRKPTAILFIDELDALAKTRSSWSSNDEREQTLNQLLTELDGFGTSPPARRQTGADHDNRGILPQRNNDDDDVTVIVMAASNRADVLDPAVLRRFDRQIHVGYPDAVGRWAVLQTHAKRIQWNRQSVDWRALANDEHTENFSGADIRNLINEAAILAVREGSTVVEQQHLVHAARRIRDMKSNLQESAPPIVPFAFR